MSFPGPLSSSLIDPWTKLLFKSGENSFTCVETNVLFLREIRFANCFQHQLLRRSVFDNPVPGPIYIQKNQSLATLFSVTLDFWRRAVSLTGGAKDEGL